MLAMLFTVTNLDDDGEGSLRDAIENANMEAGPDVIEFAPDVQGTIDLTSGELEITDDLTINGPGQHDLTVSGNEQSRVFSLVGSSVEIDHLTIADGFVTGALTRGGGVMIDGDSALSLDHVTVANNRVNANESSVDAFAEGGGIYVAGGGVLDVVHGTFAGNQSTTNRNSGGGAIYNDAGTVTIDLSTFTSNQSRTNSPDEAGDHDRYCDTPEHSPCGSNGGAITSDSFSTTTVTRSRFRGNEAISAAAIPEATSSAGGAMHSGFAARITVDHTYFGHNSANAVNQANGGAISQVAAIFPGTGTTVTDSTFVANHATGGQEAFGGAIQFVIGFGGALTVEGSRFIGNSANSGAVARGGAISNQGVGSPGSSTAHVVGSRLVGNSANGEELATGGAIASWNGATTIVDSNSIVNNRAGAVGDGASQGGGIFNDGGSSCTLTESNVNANQAIGEGDEGVGGGIYNAEGGAFEIDERTKVRGNKASTSNDDIFGELAALEELLADALMP